MATVSLSFSPVPAQVRTARMLAAALARRCGLPPELVDEVRLTVDEACSRAIAVHRRRGSEAEIKVVFVEDHRGYEVSVVDDGPLAEVPSTDVESAVAADLDARRSPADDVVQDDAGLASALSLAVVRGLVDDVEVRATPTGGTAVVLRWPR